MSPLRITTAAEPVHVNQIVVCVYGAPGVGKTSLGFSARNPLLLDFDKGVYRSANRRDAVLVESWAEVAAIRAEDIAGYDTVVIDTAGRALDLLTQQLIANDAKLARKTGELTLPGFGALKSAFARWLTGIKLLGKDVVMIAHASEERADDRLVERLDIVGGSKGEIYKQSDVMGRLMVGHDGNRVFNCSPTDTGFGKNPAQLPPLVVPDFGENPDFLGNVIETVKTHLNRMSAESQAAQSVLVAWKGKVDAAETADALTALVADAKDVKPAGTAKNVKAMIVAKAKASGWKYDEKAGGFV